MRNTARLFIAADLPQPFRRELRKISSKLEQVLPGRYVRADHHITLAFLGNTDLELTTELAECIREAVAASHVGALTLDALGSFGRVDKAVLWCGLQPEEGLLAMGHALRQNLKQANIRFDQKPLKAHITLARGVAIEGVDLAPYRPRPVMAELPSVTLYESVHKKGRLTHVPLYSERLDG